MNDNIKKLYDALIDDGYEDLGTENDFRNYCSDKQNVKSLYNALSEAGYDNFADVGQLEKYLSPSSATVSAAPGTSPSPVTTSNPQAKTIQQPQANYTQQQAEPSKQVNESQGLLHRIAGMPMQHAVVSNGTYQPAPEIEQPIVDGISGQQPAHRTPVTNQPVDAVTGANSEEDIDAIFGKYIGKGDAISETIADLMASGKANSQEQAQPLAMAALNRAAQRLAKRTTDDFVGKLGDTVANIDQSIYNGWYSHNIQDALKSSAAQLGIYNNYFENEQGGVEEVKTYDQFINSYVKPAMVESLVHKYGENYRKQAEDIATRLYSHDDAVQGEMMNRDINSAIEGVVSKYVQPSVVEEYNKAQEAGKEAFNASANKNLHLPGSAFTSLMAESKANDAQKVLDSLNKKFANLYKNGSFLTDIANATYNVMQNYGAQGGLSGKPEQYKPMIQGVLKNELTQLEVKGLMPKGSADYIIKSGLGNTILGKIERKALHSDYQNWLEDMANQQYQPGFWENVGSGALTFAGDAWSYWLPGAAGGKITKAMLAKAEGALATDLFAKGMGKNAAERAAKLIVGRSKGLALKQGMAHGATTFGGQAVVSTPVNEIYKEGQPDEEDMTYKTSVGKILYHTLGDVAKGAALGAVMQGGTLANIAGKGRGLAANILTDVGGKIADSSIMAGQSIIEHMAADPSFKPTGKDAARSFLESMANLTAIGLPGMMGKYSHFKSAQEFNRKFDFTNEDLEDLNRLGYGNLYEVFKDMGINDNRMLESDGELMGQLSQKYMDFMSSKSVPETLKAKVMAVVEGKRPDSFSPVMDSQIIQPVDGKTIIETYNEDGGIIERKQYSSIEAAEKANKELDYEKSLNLTAAYESAYHSDAMQDRLNTQYQLAVNKYNVGEKLSDEDKAAIYLHQNADAIKDVINKQQQGMELTDKEQQLWSSYKRIYDGVFENSPIMKEYIRTFEDSMGVSHGSLRKALEGDSKSRTDEQQQLVEAYQKQLYGDIVLRRDGRNDQVVKYTGNPKEGDKPQLTVKPSNTNSEQTSEENAAERATISVGGNNSPSDGVTPPSPPAAPVEEQPAPEKMNTAEPASAMPFESSPTTSEAFVMGQNAYNNGDSDSLKAISRNDDLSVARLQRLFKDNANQVSVIQKAYSEGKDMEEYINQRANYLTAAQKDAIRKYVEAQDAKKGVYDALQHADDGYGDSLKEQLWQYATEDGNIVPATLTSGQQVFLKKSNEYGGGFVVVPDEKGAPTIKQVASSEVKEVGIPVPFDEYIAQLTQAQQSNRAQAFFSQFDGSGLKPNEVVEVAMEAGDDPVQMIFAGYSPDGKIVLSDGHDNISLSKDEFNAWKNNALQSSINAELDAEDIQRSNDEAMKAEADKKQRYADNIVGYGEGQIDYSSKESNPKVVAEYLQEQYGEDHTKLINLINGSRHDVKEQLNNKKKAAAEYEQWLDTNADLDPDKAQKVNDELKLVNEQITDLEARYKNWNIIRNSVMTEDETRVMRDERKKAIEQIGIDESAIVPSEEREVPVLSDEELKKQYPTMDEASTYITSQRKQIYKIQSDEVQQELDGVNDVLEQYINGEIDLEPGQLKELSTTKAQLEARHANLNASAKELKTQADKLKNLYRKENMEERAERMANLSPAEQRAIQVENAIKDRNLSALNAIYEGTSVNFTDDTPNTIKEYVADSIGRHILNFEGKEKGGAFSNGVMQETGLDRKDFNQLQVLAREGEGMTVPEFVHKLYNDMPDHLRDQGFTDQDIRDALLDLLGSVRTYQEMKNYTLREKVANAENEMRAQEAEEERMREEYEQETMVDGQVFSERLKNAISETETVPTDAQKKAGNYKKGHLSFGGYNFTVETPKGATRSGKDENGKPWSVTMHDTYGYILGKIGVDGDHIDMFINDSADLDNFNGDVVVIDQVNPETGEFDEHKVMYGYPDEAAAMKAYLSNYSKDWKGLGKLTSVPKATFDKWLESSDRKTKPFREYAMIQKAFSNGDTKEKRIQKLRNSKPIEIKGNEIAPSDDLKQYKKNALEYGKSLRGKYTNQDTGEEIMLGKNAVKEVLNHDYKNVEQLQSVAAIPQIIEKSIYIDSMPNTDTKVNAKSFDYYLCGLKIGDVDYTVRAVFVTPKDGARYYDHKLTKIEKGKLLDSLFATTHGFNQAASQNDASFDTTSGTKPNTSVFDGKDKKLISILQTNHQKNDEKIEKTSDLPNSDLPFDAPMNMDDLPFMRTVKPIMPKDMNEAQQVAFKAVQTMLKNAGIPVKVISNEDMDKVAAEYDDMVANMLLHDPNLRFNIKTPEEREAAERAYNWGKENRPDKWHQYVLVNMDRPNQMPEYFQKKSLADIQRRYYNKNVYDDWGELRGKPWGNYKLFDLNRPFEEQVKDVKGTVPTDYDPHKEDSSMQEKWNVSSVGTETKKEESGDKYTKLFSLLDKKRNLETEYEEAAHNLEKYTDELLNLYRKNNNMAADAEVPGHVFSNAREAARVMYKKKMDACMTELKNLQKEIDALAPGGRVSFLKGKGVVYGYTDGKQIVLNQDYLNPNTPLHEYQHIWRTAAKEQNPDLIKHGDDLIRKTSLYERVKSDPNYSHLSDVEICDEAFARLIGQDGEKILEDMANEAIKQDPFETAKELSVINRLKKWLKEFWYWTLNTFTKWKPEDIKKMTLQDIRNLVLRDLANGVDPRKAHEEYVKQKDAEYMEAVKNGDMEKAAEMVKEQANLMKAENPLPDQTMAYKTRNTAAPKKTIKVYKTFTLDKDGDPSALFVSGKDKLPIGVWLDGQDTYHFLADNGKYYVPSTKNPSTEGGKTGASIRIPNDEVRQQLIDQGYLPKGSKAKSITALAYRPGWHAGDLPFFPQGGKKVDGSAYGNVHRYNQVVFECEMDADKDYTPEAQAQDKARNADGSLNARNADLQYMPEGGYYSYTTNPMLQNTDKGHWFISGSLKINRALTQEECDRILAENGKAAQEWEQGILDLDALNYDPSKTDVGRKMLSPVTYDDNGNVIPLSQRFNSGNPNARFMRGSKDDEYLKAVEDGDIEKAQKMVNEAAERVGYVSGSDYQGTSAFNGSAPWGNGYFLTKEERKEAWDNDEYDGDQTLGDYINRGIDAMNLDFIALDPRNYRSADPMRKEAIENVRNAIRKKSKTITMYRSVPADVKEGSFRNGDWVTPSRSYAVDNAKVHGWGDNYNIIEQKVPVDEIWWDGNDIAEWGYGREEDYINDTDFAYKNTKNNKKLLDAVTYDDNGNVIPLSQRFNEENSDIRFSLGVSNNVQKVKMRLVENLSDSASIIRSWLKNDRRNKSFSIELPLSTQKAIKKELGRIFNEHIITANNLAHAKANHGVNGKKVTNGSIPLRDQDFELMPYIITSPDFVRKGSVDSTGRYSIRFYKKLSNGYVVVVEKEQKNSPNDMETITMWAESTANGADALSKRKSPTIDARNVIINANDAAKIRKDAEIAIENDLKFKQRLASGGDFNNYSVVESKKIVEEVQKTATQLGGAEANVYTTIDDVPEQYRSAVEKGARGWYDPATHTVHIYLPNCADAAEAQRTVFHEKIGHEGMEVLLGGENEVRKFADYVYKNAGKDIREKILSFANKYDPNWKDNDRMNVGTQEYIAHLAEEGPKTAADFSLWTKIKHYLIRLLKRMGIRVPGLLNDKDLRYYLMKAGKALHVWDGMPKEKQEAMMQQASTKDIKNALGEGDMKGKPRQKKGESAIQYMKRVMEWRKWKEAREDLDDPEPPQFYDLDKDAAGKKEWEKLNKEWRDRHGLKGNDMPSLPIRNEGESDESFLSRYKDYEKWQNAMKDNEDPVPDMFAWEKQKQVEASKKYEDWLARHELLEQQQADLDLYEGKIYPAETSPEAADMERKVMQDLAEVTSTDVSSEGAARTVKVSVIHRRKNMEEASADDAIYINDVKRSIEQMAESGAMDKLASDFKGSKSKAESLAEAIPYIIEAPRRLRDLTHEMNASGVFDKNHLHIQPKDVEDIQTFVPELRRLASMTHTVVKNDKEVKVFDDMEGISKVASEMAKVINGNHQGEDYFVPIDGTDILDKQILPIVVQSIVPDGIDYHNLSEEMKSTLSSIRDWYNYTFDWLKDNHTLKEDVGYNADYVNHIWDKEKSDKKAYAMYVENRQRTKSPNEKKRTISTLMEGTGVGLVPKTTDITKMMAYYSRSNIEAWANKTMLQELSGINVIERDEDGEIISSDPLISSTAPFNLEQYKYFEIPGVGPVWVYNVSPKQVGKFKNPITDKEHYLYREMSAGDRFGVVFDTYQSNNFWKFMDTAASSAKKLELGFSGFHAGALTEVYMVQNMIEFGPEKALANFMKYIFVDTVKTHSLPCFANPEDFQEAATHLVKFGATNDYAAADVQNMFDDFRSAMEKIQKKLEEGNAISRAGATAALPLEVASQMLSLVNKGMDVALWDFLHDGLKLATYRMRADATKARAAKQGWTQEQLSKQLDEDGQFVNDMFGGQHWDVLGVSHTTLRYAGRILLSPDWNTSTTRHFLAVTGYGSVWNEATMNNFKQYYQHVKNAARGKQEMTPEDWGRFSRSKSALLCYGLGFMVFYEAIANGLNAAFRALDEERERKKAEELRKTNPDYRSPYELAYPDGMQWYDYLMRGNSLGQQSKIFLGRYEDGTEMYIRHGKQFREVPEYLFNHKGDLEFPGPMVQRMLGKANPMVRMTLDDINYLSDFQASHADQELQRKYGKTLGLLYKDALYWAPFLIPSQENKEFKAVDFFFPSSKGFSNWKAQDYFKTFILSGDSEGVWQTYASCQRNGLDAEKQLQAAIASIKALELKEMQDGVTSLQIASERFDDAKSVKEKRKMREKMRKFLSQSKYQAFTWQNAQDMVDAFQNGEDVKELTKADDKYLNVATSEDVTEDWRIQSIRSNSKGYADKLAELQETDKAKAAAFKNAHANIFKARKTITKANSKMNKLKKKLGEGNDKQVLQQIRNVRQELLKDLKNMEHLKKYED